MGLYQNFSFNPLGLGDVKEPPGPQVNWILQHLQSLVVFPNSLVSGIGAQRSWGPIPSYLGQSFILNINIRTLSMPVETGGTRGLQPPTIFAKFYFLWIKRNSAVKVRNSKKLQNYLKLFKVYWSLKHYYWARDQFYILSVMNCKRFSHF